VHEVHADDEALDEAVERTLAAVLRGGPAAVRAAKALIAGLRDGEPGPQALRAADSIAERRASEEGREGMAAFLERRDPSW
jgi:methylglutaconyl-CoA hydratase